VASKPGCIKSSSQFWNAPECYPSTVHWTDSKLLIQSKEEEEEEEEEVQKRTIFGDIGSGIAISREENTKFQVSRFDALDIKIKYL
jgi:hypothetical protein